MIYAAGGIVQRPKDLKIAIVFQKNLRKWTLPKGKLDGSETYEEAAVREVYEETGIVAATGDLLGHATYKGKKGKKTAYYFAMDYIEQHDVKLAKDIKEMRWVCIDEAYDLLTMKRDVKILDAFCFGPDRRRAG